MAPSLESRKLAAFRRAVSRRGSGSLDAGWTRLVRNGTPLVERIRGDRHNVLVTFVWRPPSRMSQATMYSGLAFLDPLADFREGFRLRPLGRTGIWFRSFRISRQTATTYGFAPRELPGPNDSPAKWLRYFAALEVDPHNSESMYFPKDPDDRRDVAVRFSVYRGPAAPHQRWVRDRGAPPWIEEVRRMKSRYLGTCRTVWVDRPPTYDARKGPYNLVIVFDGLIYGTSIPTPLIVQNLMAAGRIGPTVVVRVGNAPQAREEELYLNPKFAAFVAKELLPFLHRRYGLRAAASRTILAGSSAGGVASAYIAMRYPKLFGKVLAQSGAFHWSPRAKAAEPGWLIREYLHSPRLPIDFYLDAGALENGPLTPGSMTLLQSVRHFRDVLEAKGYRVHFSQFQGGHDYVSWRGTLSDGLLFLLGRN